MRRILPILIICITSCINSAYAVRIHGTILSATDNETASNAIIYAYDSQNKKIKSIVADIDGKFDANVPDNTVAVEIGFLSHAPQILPPSSLNGSTIYLQANPNMLSELVVVASRPSTTSATNSASDGCDDENNDRITPELALCSVHAYNIGEQENPSGADKQLMRDVVALKTTVITQQMNKQYEYMDAMIRRFKTQLEKAILTTKLQAAGAGTGTVR